MEALLYRLFEWFALPRNGLGAVFAFAFVSATLLPMGSEPAAFAYARLHPDQFWLVVAVGVDADVAGDGQRLGGDRARVELRVREQRAGGRQRIAAARADGDDAVLRLDHVAGAADDQRRFPVGHRQQRLELAEAAFGAPVLGHLDRGALQLAVLLELGLEQLEQGERIGRGPGEARQHLPVLAQPTHLARIGLHHRVPDGDLAVA